MAWTKKIRWKKGGTDQAEDRWFSMEMGVLIIIYGQASPYKGKYCQQLEDNIL
jgi:hypothetical protein